MKRKFMLVLSAILAMNSMPVFAAGKNSVTGIADSQEIEVSGVYQETAEAEKIISADIKWDSMTFIYARQSEGSWNPETHTYVNAGEWVWNKNSADITVVNHSNVELTAGFTWEESKSGIYAKFDKASLKLASADQGESLNHYEKAPSGVNTFRLKDNSYISDFEDGETGTIGTITVKLGSMDIPVSVSTEEELIDALTSGGSIRLANDISVINKGNGWGVLNVTSDFILDLNGHTLSYDGEDEKAFLVLEPTVENGVIKNGTMESAYERVLYSQAGNVTIDHCTLSSEEVSTYGALTFGVMGRSNEEDTSSNNTIKNSTVKGGFWISDLGCYLDITDNVQIEKDLKNNEPIFEVVDGASLKCSVNPRDYTDLADYYEVTENGDGTWTVAPKLDED